MNQDFEQKLKRALLMDCDGVLLDWVKGFTLYAEFRLKRTLDPRGSQQYNMASWLGVDNATCIALINDFNDGDGGFFGRLEPLPGAIEALQAAHLQGRVQSVITACSIRPKVVAERRQNLVNVFGDIFEDIHCVDLNASKEALLRQYDNSIWVEDKYENAVLGAACGHRAYLIRASYNEAFHADEHAHPITIVDGWDCIRRHETMH